MRIKGDPLNCSPYVRKTCIQLGCSGNHELSGGARLTQGRALPAAVAACRSVRKKISGQAFCPPQNRSRPSLIGLFAAEALGSHSTITDRLPAAKFI